MSDRDYGPPRDGRRPYDWAGEQYREQGGDQPLSPAPRKSRAGLAAVIVFVLTLVICGSVALADSGGSQHPSAGPSAATGGGVRQAPAAPAPVTPAPAVADVNCYGTKLPATECAGARATTWAAFIAAYPAGYSAASAAAYCSRSHPAGGPWYRGCAWDLRQDAKAHSVAAPAQPEPGTTTAAAAPPAPAPVHTTPPAPATGCHPTSSSGKCYEPGEFCSIAEHGESGVAGDGKSIICKLDGSYWRWED